MASTGSTPQGDGVPRSCNCPGRKGVVMLAVRVKAMTRPRFRPKSGIKALTQQIAPFALMDPWGVPNFRPRRRSIFKTGVSS